MNLFLVAALFLWATLLLSAQPVGIPAPGTITQTATTQILLALIGQIPGILTAGAAIAATILAVRNGKKTDAVGAKTDAIAEQSDKIAAQTNGHLTKLTDRNEALEKTVTTLVNILTASRVAEAAATGKEKVTTPAVRTDDIAQAIETISQIPAAQSDTPDPDLRKP